MIYSAEIILKNRDPQALSADYSAVLELIEKRDAARAGAPLPASPPKPTPKARKRKRTGAKI